MAEHADMLKAHVVIGIGAAFDIHAGLFPQAPCWIQRSGMEWAFRLAGDPGRLAPRYLRDSPAILPLLLRERAACLSATVKRNGSG